MMRLTYLQSYQFVNDISPFIFNFFFFSSSGSCQILRVPHLLKPHGPNATESLDSCVVSFTRRCSPGFHLFMIAFTSYIDFSTWLQPKHADSALIDIQTVMSFCENKNKRWIRLYGTCLRKTGLISAWIILSETQVDTALFFPFSIVRKMEYGPRSYFLNSFGFQLWAPTCARLGPDALTPFS